MADRHVNSYHADPNDASISFTSAPSLSTSYADVMASDAWRFVECCQCRDDIVVDFPLEGGEASIRSDFSLTHCGHVVCNKCVQTCSACPSCGGSLEMLSAVDRARTDKEVGVYFRGPDVMLDEVLRTVCFQISNLREQLLYYRGAAKQQGHELRRLRDELRTAQAAQSDYEAIKRENKALKSQLSGQPALQMALRSPMPTALPISHSASTASTSPVQFRPLSRAGIPIRPISSIDGRMTVADTDIPIIRKRKIEDISEGDSAGHRAVRPTPARQPRSRGNAAFAGVLQGLVEEAKTNKPEEEEVGDEIDDAGSTGVLQRFAFQPTQGAEPAQANTTALGSVRTGPGSRVTSDDRRHPPSGFSPPSNHNGHEQYTQSPRSGGNREPTARGRPGAEVAVPVFKKHNDDRNFVSAASLPHGTPEHPQYPNSRPNYVNPRELAGRSAHASKPIAKPNTSMQQHNRPNLTQQHQSRGITSMPTPVRGTKQANKTVHSGLRQAVPSGPHGFQKASQMHVQRPDADDA